MNGAGYSPGKIFFKGIATVDWEKKTLQHKFNTDVYWKKKGSRLGEEKKA